MPLNLEVRLQDVVNGRLLNVADYQRPYAWQDKQLADLWDDIDLLGPTGTHYAGTLVLRDRGDRGDVIDEEGTTLRTSKSSMGNSD